MKHLHVSAYWDDETGELIIYHKDCGGVIIRGRDSEKKKWMVCKLCHNKFPFNRYGVLNLRTQAERVPEYALANIPEAVAH